MNKWVQENLYCKKITVHLQGFLTLKLQVFAVLSILRYFPCKIRVNLLVYGKSSCIYNY